MAIIRDIIEQIDENKPNAFSAKAKVIWLAELEGKIAADVFLMDIEEVQQFCYRHPDDMETETLVRFPHDGIYALWLGAKIDFENGEYEKYQNGMEMFNASYGNFVRRFASVYDPARGYRNGRCSSCDGNPPYYISAYGLAVSRGFEGTLEEWLLSLVGKSGKQGDGVALRLDGDQIQWRPLPVADFDSQEGAGSAPSPENEIQWQDLIDVATLRGEIVEQTLLEAEQAEKAAALCAAAAEEAAKEAVLVLEETKSNSQAAEDANTSAKSAMRLAAEHRTAAEDAAAAAKVSAEQAAEYAAQAGAGGGGGINLDALDQRIEDAIREHNENDDQAHPDIRYVLDDLGQRFGDLEQLETEDKSSLVAAVNEVLGKAGTGGSGGNADQSGKTALDTFLDNVDVDYAYDADTGANYTIIRIYKNKIDGSVQYPFVYAPNGAGKGTQDTKAMTTEKGFLLAINAGVFDNTPGDETYRKPDGIVIQNGVVVQNAPLSTTHAGSKPLTISADGTLGYAEADADAEELVDAGIVSAVCGFMPIIIDYEAVPDTEWNSIGHYTQNAQRQIIGQFGNGDYAIVTCEGRDTNNSDGWTIAEAQTICRRHGLKFAYNLDGGGSTETMLGLKHLNTYSSRIVPTFIVFNGKNTLDETIIRHTITNSLSNVTTSNGANGVLDGSAYSATLTADNGYILSNVTVTMGGVDITANVYSTGNINIPKVTGDVVISAVAILESSTTIYTISANLTNVVISNGTTNVEEFTAYSATLTPDSGYILSNVVVTMGGVDITGSAYADGAISIPSVTGNVTITATAEESAPTAVEGITWATGIYPHSSGSFRSNAKAISALMTEGDLAYGTSGGVTYYLIPVPTYATKVTLTVPDGFVQSSAQHDFWYSDEPAPSFAGNYFRFATNEATFEAGKFQYLSVVFISADDVSGIDLTKFGVAFK